MNSSDKKQQQASPQRRIRSYVIRSGRMTASQQQALVTHLQQWGLRIEDGPCDFDKIFSNDNPVNVEIGFGMGDSLAEMAERNPQENYIGIEVHRAGVGRLLALATKKQLQNVRVYDSDAVEVLKHCMPAASLARVNIFFPDPWHKKRHHKRRLIQAGFVELLSKVLQPGGLLHIATDWLPYAEEIVELMREQQCFENVAGEALFVNPEDYGRPGTKFERRGQKLGHGVRDMVYRYRP